MMTWFPLEMTGAKVFTALVKNERSGTFSFLNGVGTEIIKTSAGPGLVSARNFPDATPLFTSLSSPGSISGVLPFVMEETTAGLTSTQRSLTP